MALACLFVPCTVLLLVRRTPSMLRDARTSHLLRSSCLISPRPWLAISLHLVQVCPSKRLSFVQGAILGGSRADADDEREVLHAQVLLHTLARVPGQVVTCFFHDLQCQRVDRLRDEAGAVYVEPVARVTSQHRFSHLAAGTVAGAEEQHVRDRKSVV